MIKLGQFALLGLLGVGLLLSTGCGGSGSGTDGNTVTLLNVSYDPTRELYVEYNEGFKKHWLEKTGQNVLIEQSHGGGGKQCRAVIDGLKADILTQAISYDVDTVADKAKLFPKEWQERLPNNSCPYTTTIVFLVRSGNPKGIKDWGDLIKPGVQVITPNPKTSGGARLNYMAAWVYALRKANGNEDQAKEFISTLYKNVPVLDSGARGSTTTFVQRGIGDVLLTWENEAFLAINELGADKVEMVVPPTSILAEPPVTVVDKNAERHGALEVAQEYVDYLYSPFGQQTAAKHYYRPSRPDLVEDQELLKRFPQVELFTVAETFGTWDELQKKHFHDGGIFDSIFIKK